VVRRCNEATVEEARFLLVVSLLGYGNVRRPRKSGQQPFQATIPKRPEVAAGPPPVTDSAQDRIRKLRVADLEMLKVGPALEPPAITAQGSSLPACLIGARYEGCDIMKKVLSK